MNDEFYIGWENKAAPGIGRFVRRTVLVLVLAAIIIPASLAVSQRLIGMAVFEWGTKNKFTGIFQAWPYPHLLVPRPTGLSQPENFSTYFLVAPWKFGLSPEVVMKFDGKFVSLSGTLIYRDAQTMIEVNGVDITEDVGKSVRAPLPEVVSLGRQTLAGEIVDSKCYFGVMNPGQLTTHRACAELCISGGIPPVLVVTQSNGPSACLLLVSSEGKAVNQQVLDWVAEPVEITGEVKKQDGLLVLYADPSTYHQAK
jgi:hypothetical protein